MVSRSRKINLITKLNPEVFKIINKDIYGTTETPLGSVQGAVNRILLPEYSNMLKSIMPTIISVNPEDLTWFKRIKYYWDSFGIKVPVGGKELEIGFNFDITSTIKTDIAKLIASTSVEGKAIIETDDQLANYVLDPSNKISEFDLYKYGTPINPEQYLTWVFLLGHRKVAKQSDVINKSTNIEFFLVDPKEIDNTRRAQHTLSNEALKKYLELLTDRQQVRDILYIKGIDASAFDDLDCDAKLKNVATSDPKGFLAITKDSSLKTKARIERYCVAGILKRLPSSSIIVDANDSGTVVGNSTEEAIAFFSSEAPDKVSKVKEFKARYAQLKKN